MPLRDKQQKCSLKGRKESVLEFLGNPACIQHVTSNKKKVAYLSSRKLRSFVLASISSCWNSSRNDVVCLVRVSTLASLDGLSEANREHKCWVKSYDDRQVATIRAYKEKRDYLKCSKI